MENSADANPKKPRNRVLIYLMILGVTVALIHFASDESSNSTASESPIRRVVNADEKSRPTTPESLEDE